MLVLTRRLDEVIHIGQDISITIVQIDGGKVRLGIDAPREIKIMRPEVLDRERRHILPFRPAELASANS